MLELKSVHLQVHSVDGGWGAKQSDGTFNGIVSITSAQIWEGRILPGENMDFFLMRNDKLCSDLSCTAELVITGGPAGQIRPLSLWVFSLWFLVSYWDRDDWERRGGDGYHELLLKQRPGRGDGLLPGPASDGEQTVHQVPRQRAPLSLVQE